MYKYIQKKSDGTFIVEFRGYPFHVTSDYPPTEMYGEEMAHAAIAEYASAHPEEVTEYVEPELLEPNEETLKQARIAELEAESQRLIPYIQAGLDVEINQQKLIDIILELEDLKGNLE